MDLLTWLPGPPPPNLVGGTIVLCRLDEAEVRNRLPPAEYYGDPVAVAWWSHKGKDALSQWRIDPDMVVSHCLLSRPHRD